MRGTSLSHNLTLFLIVGTGVVGEQLLNQKRATEVPGFISVCLQRSSSAGEVGVYVIRVPSHAKPSRVDKQGPCQCTVRDGAPRDGFKRD